MRELIIIAFLFLLSFPGLGQELSTRNKKAAELYGESESYMIRRQYKQAIDLLGQAVNRDFGFTEAHLRLADAYKLYGDASSARKYYEEVIKQRPGQAAFASAYLSKAALLKGPDYFDEVIALAETYLMLLPEGRDAGQARRLVENARFAKEAIQNPLDFTPRPLPAVVNNFDLQYFPVLTADENTLFFTARNTEGPNNDEDIFISQKLPSGDFRPPQSISWRINTRYNEGTCTISADGRMMIFTACEGRKGFGSCDLYYTYKNGDQWSIPENLGPTINTQYWESQPSLSADGNVLFFVSNRPAGKGGRDIYLSRRDEEGNWEPAENLGEPVNSSGDEVSPFIHANGMTLFFSSNEHPGFGGYDLFSSEWKKTVWSMPRNLGYPINTEEDQVSLFISASGKTGYYSNERKRGNVYVESKLYMFDVPPEIQVDRAVSYVKGRVVDALTGAPIPAAVELYDLLTEERSARVLTDSLTGEYMITLTEGSEYALYISRDGYLFDSRNFSVEDNEELNVVLEDILLNRIEKGKSVNLNNLFFDFDAYTLREKSKIELKKIVAFLERYPDLRIEVEGHTDNVGDAAYNQNLSFNRAKAIFNFLVGAGISADRVEAKGYGMTKPIASNTSETGRQQNRRIAFKIL
jgi:outer membrane protein OmpA-like peptidoglycan-associated protein/tetratricopeptide (TPR) repeat protein